MATSAIDRPNLRSPYWIPLNNSSNALSHDHITEALNQSTDDGETLVFSKLDLTDISVEAAEELATRLDKDGECTVKRITLDNNRLTTLPMELALLTRLRYLNLKHNSFSSFPRALTLIKTLDTLDISHNKIRRLPNEPGNLVNLRVFCFSRNKISRLPVYLSHFSKLEVLRADRNPIEWPPKAVMECPSPGDPKLMEDWIQSVQKWIEAESSRNQSDDKGFNNGIAHDRSIDESWRFPIRDGDFDEVSFHTRSYSADSNASLSSIAESLHESAPETLFSNRPPPLHLGILQSNSAEPSPTHSPRGGISPSSDYNVKIPSTFEQIQSFEPLPPHTRTASCAEGTRSPTAPIIFGKKSLPDLRNIHTPMNGQTPALPIPHAAFQPSGLDIGDDSSLHYSAPSSSSFSLHPKRNAPATNLYDIPDATPIIASNDGVNSVASERNSYFRRLSTLPLSSSHPQHITNLAESARSFLFAMCQIYQSLEQYAALVTDDRFSVVLRKVLDPAHSDMMRFIRVLEKFDSTSRASLPTPAISRNLIEKCRDCAAAFGKVVNILALRLQVDPGGDLRFSRWMLLELHAATAEIAGAWKTMQIHMDNLKSYLHTRETLTASDSTSSLVVPSQHTMRVGISGRNRTARRHAGSFSSKDVEIGKKLPSYDIPSALTGGVLSGPAPHVPTLRTPKRQATAPVISSVSKIASSLLIGNHNTLSEDRFGSHVRQNSQKSTPNFSPSSSPSLIPKLPGLDVSGSSKRKVDFEALNAIQNAVGAAPKVWDMIADTIVELSQNERDVRAILEQARSATRKLSDIISKIQGGDLMSERKVLQEDAQTFVKALVKVSNFVKAYSVDHSVPSALRSSLVQLTNLTEEFAILLHVSSFAPATPRSFSPMLNSTNLNQDGRLASNLSRAKSANSPVTIKIPLHSSLHDGPRSALPTQSFKIADNARLPRPVPDLHTDTSEPG